MQIYIKIHENPNECIAIVNVCLESGNECMRVSPRSSSPRCCATRRVVDDSFGPSCLSFEIEQQKVIEKPFLHVIVGDFQAHLVILLVTLLGIDTKAEVHTSDGRIDLLIETPEFIYIIEIKYDATPEQALRQIEEKRYARKFATDGRKLFKIGVSFSSGTRRIEAWKIKD